VLPLRDNVPTRSQPFVTWALIIANVLAFVLYELGDLQGAVNELGYHPCEVEGSCPQVGEGWLLTAFTSMFLHGDWVHLLGNMLFLWIFGNNVEDAFGHVRFFIFYVVAGLAATALQTAVTLSASPDVAATIPNIGASGAISGVLGAYLVLLPGARVLTLVLFVLRELPAWLFLGFWIVFQLYDANFQLRHPPEGGGVAVFAHVGGFLVGVLAVVLFRVRRPVRPAY
jgi:membrane associated rhomboid family serine protease